ncbi:helix-turn-helix domain-containing protein [Salipaludibacillus sp. HK11]
MKVVECGSYTRAAVELDYAQSSVTNHIQKLEEIYRFPPEDSLFHREKGF